MRNLTATICLTIAVLFGSAGVSWSADFKKGYAAFQSGDFATALREWEPIVMSWLETAVPFIAGFTLAAIIAAILIYRYARNEFYGVRATKNSTEHYSALDNYNLLQAYRREYSNIMIRNNPKRFLEIYEKSKDSKMEIKNLNDTEKTSILTSLCDKYFGYSDFDILKSMEFYLYEDVLTESSISFKDIEETYLDIVKFEELKKLTDYNWSKSDHLIDFSDEEYHNELKRYIRTLPENVSVRNTKGVE